MAYNPNKELKLYYSIGEVAKMFDVNESLLRYWEKEFPIISPKKAGGNVRQYRKEDIENIRLVYHLVKEKGMTLQGAKQKLKMNRETTIRTTEILDRSTSCTNSCILPSKIPSLLSIFNLWIFTFNCCEMISVTLFNRPMWSIPFM